MERNLAEEIDKLKNEILEIKEKIKTQDTILSNERTQQVKSFFLRDNDEKSDNNNVSKGVHIVKNIHPDKTLDEKLGELCQQTKDKGISGLISHLGVFYSNDRQHNWISSGVNIDDLLKLIENKMVEKVLNCIGNSDRLNILLAILKKPMSVAEIVKECKLNSTGQAYHHMRPLLVADLIVEDINNNKGVYAIQPHKVQGIIMMLAGISDIVDETYSKGNWDDN